MRTILDLSQIASLSPQRQWLLRHQSLLVLMTLSLLFFLSGGTDWPHQTARAAVGLHHHALQRAMPAAGNSAGARIEVTPYGNIYASTWNDNSFKVTNTSTGGQRITGLTLDLRSALLPDLVFDPDGKAGDQYAKGLTPNEGAADVGYSGHQLTGFHNGSDDDDGFDQLTITFNDFGPGELFGFSIDIDPTSIKGLISSGPQEAGSVSGLELTGARVTLNFSDGSTQTVALFHRENSSSGSENLVRSAPPPQPSLTMPGVTTPTTRFQAAQTLRVQAPSGSQVRLFHVEAGLFELGAGGYDIDPFEANSVVGWQEYAGTVGGSGRLDVAVTLTKTFDAAGLHYFIAAVEAADGMTGLTSNLLVVEYAPEGNRVPVIAPLANQTHQEGEAVTLAITASDPDDRPQPLTYSATNLPAGLAINPTSGAISGIVAVGAAAASPYQVTVSAGDGADRADTTLQWVINPLSTPTPIAPTPTITATPQPTATPTATATGTATVTPIHSSTVTPTATPSLTPTATLSPTTLATPTVAPDRTPVGTGGERIYLPLVGG